MSWNAVLEFEAAGAEDGAHEPPLDWLLGMLKQAMEETMASDAGALAKANALARLASLYLKAYGAAELTKQNKQLKQRLQELEDAQARDAGPVPAATAPPTAPAPAGLPRRLPRPARPRHVKRR